MTLDPRALGFVACIIGSIGIAFAMCYGEEDRSLTAVVLLVAVELNLVTIALLLMNIQSHLDTLIK
jgi:hypothetical protein